MTSAAPSEEAATWQTSFPASKNTGAAKKTFIPAYTAPPANPPSPFGTVGRKKFFSPRVKKNTNASKTGTSAALSAAIPFMPLESARQTKSSPAQERSGLKCGASASKPASIPAQGTKAQRRSAPRTAGAALPKSASVAPRYPPWRLPRARSSALNAKYSAAEQSTGKKYDPVRKKRTSSAPDKNPAPMLVPTIKNTVLKIPISLIYGKIDIIMKKSEIFLLFMSDIVLCLLTNFVGYYIIEKNKEKKGMDEQYGDEPEEELPSDEQTDEQAERDDRSISSDLIPGHINTIILRALCDGDKYGYEIIAEIERKSHGQYSIKQPSLYSALKRLEKDGYITSYWGGSVGGGRRKYFSLTDEGRAIAEQNQSEWEYSRTVIDSLISDKDFDFSNPAPASVNMRVLRSSTSRVPSRDEEDEEELPFAPLNSEENERLAQEYEAKNKELETMRAALEAERLNFEEEMNRSREELRIEKEEQDKLLSERERLMESERQEMLRDGQNAASAEREAFDEQLRAEQERCERILKENEEAIEAERAAYESALAEQEQRIREREEALNAARAEHERQLAEQEQRIREEQEALFHRREQELIHQNYVNLVNVPPVQERDTTEYTYYTAPVAEETEELPAQQATAGLEPDDEDYRAVVGKLYSGAVSHEEEPAERRPADETRAQSLDGVDFSDVEAKAAYDGIKLTTAGGKPVKEAIRSESLVNKGKALFLSAIVVFFLCVAEGSIVIGIQGTYSLPLFYPYFIWGTGLALLLVTGLLYANHYGERALRKTGLILVNAVVGYILVVIVVLIVALAIPIDFSAPRDLATFLAIPILFFFGIVVFGICYYLQVRSYRKD